jgi:hypothetical protein
VDNLPDFKTARADVLAVHQMRLLEGLTDDSLKEVSPYQKVGMFGILYDKERLERGQSTANVAYADMSKALGDLEAEERELRAKLGQGDRSDYEQD